jgi:tripartite-type tricarboxylate transporter receptor subunit TctC
MPRRPSLGCLLLAALSLLLMPAPAPAQDYPSRPIRLIITSPAGSLVDVLGRLIADELGTRLGQTVVVDNRPGAMTQVGSDAINRAAADGYTLMIGTSEMTMMPALKKGYRYDPIKDFTPIALVASSWTVFAIHPAVPAKTLPELIDYSRSNPAGVRYGSGGIGGALHIAVEMLKLKSGGNFVHTPSRGGAHPATDAVSGQIDMVSMGLASARVAEGGKLRVLAQTGPSRHPLFSDVPTTAEVSLPDVRMDTWFGLIAPPNLPEPIVAQIARAVEAASQQQSFREKLFKIGCDVAWKSPADFTAFLSVDRDKWAKLIPSMGITLPD